MKKTSDSANLKISTPLSISSRIARSVGEAVSNFSMIEGGDSIMVGLSGGKDSLMLCAALSRLMRISPVEFSISALVIDPTNGALDTSRLEEFALSLGISFQKIPHPIFDIIASREESSPCSLCANLRRGILATRAKESGCNVLALGHHRDDAVETALLNLFNCGRFKCFHPSMVMSRSGVRVIRPLIYVREAAIAEEARRLVLPIADCNCPYAGDTGRALVKRTIAELKKNYPRIESNILHALEKMDDSDSWRAFFSEKMVN